MIRIPPPSSLLLVSRGCSHSVPLLRYHSAATTARTISILPRVSTPLPTPAPPPFDPRQRHQFSSLLRRTFSTNHAREQAANVSPPPSESFTFYTAASFSPKGKDYDPESEIFSHVSGSQKFAPDPEEPKSRAGQDAFFVTGLEKLEGAVAVGVADGVSGYIDFGFDSGFVSQGLCNNIASLARAAASAAVDPKDLLAGGFEQLLKNPEIKGGATTACLGVYKTDGVLNVANMGDSAYVIFRQGKIHYMSKLQTHDRNVPFQLECYRPRPNHIRWTHDDNPGMASTSTHQLQEGDVVVFATDGVWDNLFLMGDILKDVSAKMLKTHCWKKKKGRAIAVSSEHLAAAMRDASGALHTTLARAVVAMAKTASMGPRKAPPESEMLLDPNIFGLAGKEDDITAVVTVVTKVSPNPSVPKPAAHL